MEQRLTKGSINLAQVYYLSRKYYQSKVDDKKRRARIDIVSGKVTSRRNMEFDRSTGQWTQTGKEAKIVFRVTSDPKSYVKTDTLKKHTYTVTFLLKDLSMGILSPFKWRTGGQKNVSFVRSGMRKEDREKIANKNILDDNQLNFFYHIEFVSKLNGTLFGRCRAKWFPKKTNPKGLLYFDKTSYFVVDKILFPLLVSGKGLQLNKSVKND